MSEPSPAPERPSRDLRYINILASLLAVFVSLLSLWLAWSSNRTQERMLAASSWPYLRFGHGNLADDGSKVIELSLRNGGSGPAVLHWMRLRSKERTLADANAVLRWAAPESEDLVSWSSGTTQVPMPPGDELKFMQFHHNENQGPAWDALNRERWKLELQACYCSLIGDCWMLESASEPKPVDACPAPPKDAWQG